MADKSAVEVVASLPKAAHGKVDWALVASTALELKANGDTESWVKVPEPLYSENLRNFKRGSIRALDPTKFEMTTQRFEGGPRRTFYVRAL